MKWWLCVFLLFISCWYSFMIFPYSSRFSSFWIPMTFKNQIHTQRFAQNVNISSNTVEKIVWSGLKWMWKRTRTKNVAHTKEHDVVCIFFLDLICTDIGTCSRINYHWKTQPYKNTKASSSIANGKFNIAATIGKIRAYEMGAYTAYCCAYYFDFCVCWYEKEVCAGF